MIGYTSNDKKIAIDFSLKDKPIRISKDTIFLIDKRQVLHYVDNDLFIANGLQLSINNFVVYQEDCVICKYYDDVLRLNINDLKPVKNVEDI